jgi:hypothetical protein
VTGHGYPVLDSNPQGVLARSNSRKSFFKPLFALYSLLQRNFSDHRHSFGVFVSVARLINLRTAGSNRAGFLPSTIFESLLLRSMNTQGREELALNSLPS